MKSFPDNKSFAFSIFDDTDLSTADNVAPVYRLLSELGMRTTKSVWPLATVVEGKHGGCSLQDPEYLSFILHLQDLGFEIAMHNMRNHHCSRELVQRGFAEFRRLVGQYPRAHANHSRNRENLYWGAARFRFLKLLYALGARFAGERSFEGHVPESESFWGDLCHDHLDYVRNFVFRGINLDRVNPTMPYHDPAKPLVKYWFSSCDGSDVESFCNLLSRRNQERLERERGVCIVYAFCVRIRPEWRCAPPDRTYFTRARTTEWLVCAGFRAFGPFAASTPERPHSRYGIGRYGSTLGL